MARRLSDEKIAEIRRRFDAGEHKKYIAKAMKIHANTVKIYTPRAAMPPLTDNQKKEIVRLVESGKSKPEVARQFGVAPATVSKFTTHVKRKPEAIPKEVKAKLIERAFAGEPLATISRDLKLHRGTVQSIVRRSFDDYLLTEAQKSAILVARADEQTVPQIAAELKIPVMVINKELGIDYGAVKPSDEMREAVVRAVESGETLRSVSKRHGIGTNAIRGWVKAAIACGDAKAPRQFPSKRDDHRFTWITRQDPQLEEWQRLIAAWFEAERPSASAAIYAVSAFIDRYLIGLNLPKKPADLLQRGSVLPDFHETSCPKRSTAGRDYAIRIYKLIEWVLDTEEFADHDDGEIVRLSHLYRNPFNIVSGTSVDEPKRPPQSGKTVMPYFLISDLRKRIVQGPHFRDWTWVQGLLGRETINGQTNAGDWFGVTEDQIDKNDPDIVWRLRKREENTPVLEMWSPVRWVHALFHLQTPPRGGQARMVDSGEADTFIWNGSEFVPNTGPLRMGTGGTPRAQGVFRQPSQEDADQGARVVLYFNSNKTADIGKSGKDKGYECAWPKLEPLEENPYYWLAKLRDWQMKVNPIKRLTRWNELTGAAKLSARHKDELAEYPDTAFLFRTPEDKEHPDWPLSSSDSQKAWQKLMAAYQDVLAQEGITRPGGEPIELINPINGAAYSSQHSTRVSLITHLILDANVGVEIMMKLAGHARFIMTVYYTKAGLTHIQDAIKVGTEKLEAMKYATFERDLKNASAEQIRQKVVFNTEDWQTVLPANPADRNALGWSHLHDGICLAGGNTSGEATVPGCHNGGPVIRILAKKTPLYGPVPGGIRNCCRCRWKCSGKEHIRGLAASYDNRSYHFHKQKEIARETEQKRNEIMRDKARVEAAGDPYIRMNALIEVESRHEAAMQKWQELGMDIVAIQRTIERVMDLPDEPGSPTALVANGDLLTLNMVIEETDSELLQLAGVAEDLQIYPNLDAGTAVYEFHELMEHAFETQGHPLPRARLSQQEKLVYLNGIMRELERLANPENPILGRRKVVEIMDRGESLEKMLGVKLKSVLQLADHAVQKPIPLRLVKKEGTHDE
ncbi:MAG: VPA1269 family protein [Sulfuritalea sp.]|nr:VPA1269 family protein [Sulfuritalea sp.]